jgi:hypothetical protein
LSGAGAGRFVVIVADNFHYMDEDEKYEHARFETLDAAIGASKVIVDKYLLAHHQPGMTAEQLFSSYASFGEDPYIRDLEPAPQPRGVLFSAWTYAKERCAELCGVPPPA